MRAGPLPRGIECDPFNPFTEEGRMPQRLLNVFAIAAVAAIGFLAIGPAAQTGTATAEWRHYGGDAGSTKHSPLDQINREQRRPAPASRGAGARPTTRSPRRIHRSAAGRVPGHAAHGQRRALHHHVARRVRGDRPRHRQTIWQHDPETWKAGRPPNLGFMHRGLAYLDRRQEPTA